MTDQKVLEQLALEAGMDGDRFKAAAHSARKRQDLHSSADRSRTERREDSVSCADVGDSSAGCYRTGPDRSGCWVLCLFGCERR